MRYTCRNIFIFLIVILVSTICEAQENDLYKIEKLEVNSNISNDFAPVLFQNGILFCSTRKNSIITGSKTFDGEIPSNIYFANRNDTSKWGKARLFSKDLSSLFYEGPFCFTPDGDTIYFTRNIEIGKRAQDEEFQNYYGIFIANKEGANWVDIRAFEHNDGRYKVAHPCISSDGKYLFYSSNEPLDEPYRKSKGGSDIFMSEWVNGKWSKGQPLEEVNTTASELYPYFSPSQDLIFASDRQGGHGGLDLYRSTLSYGSWTKPVLLPEPLNSPADDFSLIYEEGMTSGYFTSNRDRDDDIYSFTSLIRRMAICDTQVQQTYCYEFYEEKTMEKDSLPFEYEWDFGDGTKDYGVVVNHCFEEPGTYVYSLIVLDTLTGDILKSEESIIDIKRKEQAFIISADTCNVNEVISFDASFTYLPGWNIEEYYWNFDDGSVGTGIITDKSFQVPGIYNVQLILSSIPDTEGVVTETCVSKYVIVE